MGISWTEKRRKEYKDRIMLTKPWEKSTGARTPEGKAITSQNAKKHFTERKSFLDEMAASVNKLSRLSSELAAIHVELALDNPNVDSINERLEAIAKKLRELEDKT